MTSKQEQLKQFIILVEADRIIWSISQRLSALFDQKQAIENEHTLLKNDLESSKRAVADAQKGVDQQELNLQVLNDQEKNKKRQLDQSTNGKQYQLSLKELMAIHEAQAQHEEQVLAAWKLLEIAQRQYEQLNRQYEEKHGAIEERLKKIHTEIEQLQSEIQEHETKRQVQEKSVPEEWLERYARMRLRVDNPVVPIVGTECSICFHTVTHQDAIRLRRQEIITCQGCFRLLFAPDVHS